MKKLKYYILLFSFFGSTQVMSQINIDSLFTNVIEYSKEENYEKAIDLSEQIISIDHTRIDIKIFLANLYAWQNDYDKAKSILEKVYENNPENDELYDTWLNVLLWNREYENLLKLIHIAESNSYDNEFNLSLKRLMCYQELGLYNTAIEYVDSNPGLRDSVNVDYIYKELYKLKYKNVVSAFSRVDYLSDNSYQFYGFIDYNRNIGKNNVLFRLNYANRFNTNDFLPEIDYYQTISKKDYIYFNFGIGLLKELFPKQRAGIEYYRTVKGFDLSLGGRVLNFNNNPVYIITSQVEKSFSNYSIGIRPYYSFQNQQNALSVVSNFKRYWKKHENYSGIQLAYGNSPDDNYYNLQENILLENYWLRVENNFHISVSSILNVAFRYTYEETTSNNFRNRYSIELLFKQRF